MFFSVLIRNSIESIIWRLIAKQMMYIPTENYFKFKAKQQHYALFLVINSDSAVRLPFFYVIHSYAICLSENKIIKNPILFFGIDLWSNNLYHIIHRRLWKEIHVQVVEFIRHAKWRIAFVRKTLRIELQDIII